MGTNATFRFHYNFLEVEFSYEGSYALGSDFTGMPKIWNGTSGFGEHIAILDIKDVLVYFSDNPPQHGSLSDMLNLLQTFDLDKVKCYPRSSKGFPRNFTDTSGCMTLETGL